MFTGKEYVKSFLKHLINKDREELDSWEREVNLYRQSLVDKAYKKFCKESTDYSWYVESMIHEINTFNGNIVNNLTNYFFYLKKDIKVATEIENALYYSVYMYCLLLQSLDIFYNWKE